MGKQGKHRKSRAFTRLGAILAGMIAGATMLSANPAAAHPVNVPGLGIIDVPELPQNIIDAAQSPQGEQVISQAPVEVRTVVDQIVPISLGMRVLHAAQTAIGTPYVWGGTHPGAFDCSGLVQWSYAQAGVPVPRTSYGQAGLGHPVPVQDIQPGDVVIYYGGSHVGLYAGNGQVLHAPHEGDHVRYSPLNSMPIVAVRHI